MKKTFLFSLLAAGLFIAAGCTKDSTVPDNSCEMLSTGLSGNDAVQTGHAINQLISKLTSSEYSGDNLDRLAEKMSNGCGIMTTVTCLNCNHIVPLESELTASYTVAGVPKQMIIVIVQTAANKMAFQSMRE